MAVLLRVFLTLSVLLTLLMTFGLYTEAADFNFSTDSLAISEKGDLSQMLFINKTGENTETIEFQVIVTPGTATPINDYTPNDDHLYVFTSATTFLPIETRLVTDRAGESLEYFMICLPDFQSMDVRAVSPICVNITIIDDDSVVIGFQDTVTVMEGGPPQMVCAEVKDFGLQLDPFDSVPLDIRTGTGSEAVLGTTSLTFEASNTVRCTTVSVPDNNLVDGTRTSQVILSEQTPVSSSVPTELYPGSIQLYITDNDVIRFSFDSQQPTSYTLLEGERVSNITIEKFGNATRLNFIVTPAVIALGQALSGSEGDIVVTGPPQFTPSDFRGDIVVDIPDDSTLNSRRQFSISINSSNIEATNRDGVHVSAEGEPIQITVYDNDFDIRFTNESIKVTPANSTFNVCVAIQEPQAPDIHPSINIPLSITIGHSTSVLSGSQVFEKSNGTLNATNTTVCFYANFSGIADRCNENITLELFLMTDQINYHNNTATVLTNNCPSTNSRAVVAGVIPSLFIVIIIIIVVCIILACYLLLAERRKNRERQQTNTVVALSEVRASESLENGTESNKKQAHVSKDVQQPQETRNVKENGAEQAQSSQDQDVSKDVQQPQETRNVKENGAEQAQSSQDQDVSKDVQQPLETHNAKELNGAELPASKGIINKGSNECKSINEESSQEEDNVRSYNAQETEEERSKSKQGTNDLSSKCDIQVDSEDCVKKTSTTYSPEGVQNCPEVTKQDKQDSIESSIN